MGARTRYLAALLGAAGLLAVAGPVAGAAPMAAGASDPPASTLAWTPCPEVAPGPPGEPPAEVPIECATVDVPLRYGQAPGGRTIPVALYRLVSPNHGGDGFRGSVVINPGGPGGDGRSFLAGVGPTMPQAIRDAYDIVAFDPRGVGASDGITCGLGVPFPYELDGDPVADQLAVGAALGAECLAEDAELLPTMGTQNVARDLDRIRAALGEEELDYLGYSYGTAIGSVYATLFPDRVGRFTLDGVSDPALSYRSWVIEQMRGFDDAFERFFAACDAEPTCPFGPDSAARFAALLQQAADEGLPVAGGEPIDETTFMAAAVPYLYAGHVAAPALAAALAAAEAGDASQLAADAESGLGIPIGTYFAVVCADADATYGRPEANFATWSLRDDPLLAPGALEILTCAGFPAAEEPAPVGLGDGPLPPALLIGTTGDPATPYAGAVALQEAWEGSVLLTFEAATHTATGWGSTCVVDAVAAWMAEGTLPEGGTRCRPDRVVGIEIGPADDGLAVVFVDPAGPLAGVVQPGDVIVAIEGGPPDPEVGLALIETGEPFSATVRRGGETFEVTTAGELPPYWAP